MPDFMRWHQPPSPKCQMRLSPDGWEFSSGRGVGSIERASGQASLEWLWRMGSVAISNRRIWESLTVIYRRLVSRCLCPPPAEDVRWIPAQAGTTRA